MKALMKLRARSELQLFCRHWMAFAFWPIYLIYFSVILIRNIAFYNHVPVKTPLWDSMFVLLPEIDHDSIQNVPQWFIWGSTALYIPLAVFVSSFHKKKRFGFVSFVITYTLLSLMHTVRMVTYSSTRLSSPVEDCLAPSTIDKPQKISGQCS